MAALICPPCTPAANGGQGSINLEFNCIRCGLKATLTDSTPTGSKSVTSREHKVCSSIKRSFLDRCKYYPGLKHWFKAASAKELQDWFLRQRERGQFSGKTRDWDDHGIEHLTEKGSRKSKAQQVQWENFEMYSDRRFAKAAAYNDANYKKAMAMLEDEWKKSFVVK